MTTSSRTPSRAPTAVSSARGSCRRTSRPPRTPLPTLAETACPATLLSGLPSALSAPLAPTRYWRETAAPSTSSLPDEPQHVPLSPGISIAGRFRIDRRIGSGGMGEVWEGEHLAVQMKVAIKALLPRAYTCDELVQRFAREARLLARVHSDHVARVVDFVEDERFGPLLVMEYIEGESLNDLITRRKLTIEEALDIGIDIADAICELHRSHIVHRDIKPQNVMLQPIEHGRSRAVIIDLGISRMLHEDGAEADALTQDGIVVGTVEYMAPEQVLSSRDVTAAADQYALGALLFRAATGRHVIDKLHGMELARAKLKPVDLKFDLERSDAMALGFEQIVSRALSHDPTERYATMSELRSALAVLRSIATHRSSRPPRAETQRLGRFLPLTGAAIVGAAIALALVPQKASSAQKGAQHHDTTAVSHASATNSAGIGRSVTSNEPSDYRVSADLACEHNR